MKPPAPPYHPMLFKRFGRSYHLHIENARDLAHVLKLDEAHWVATGAPVCSLTLDPTFLSLVDHDANGRIMCCEIRDAIRWLLTVLSKPEAIAIGNATLRLDTINTDTEDGNAIHTSATKILQQSGTVDTGAVTLEQVRELKARVEQNAVSEVGAILPTAAEAEEIQPFLEDIVATVGGVPHPSGNPGVNEARMQEFLRQCREHLEWREAAELPDGAASSALLPLGTATGDGYRAVEDIREKLDEYFAQCRVAQLDPRAAEVFSPDSETLRSVDPNDPAALEELLREAPLTTPSTDVDLDLTAAVNPYYAPALKRLHDAAIAPVLGKNTTALTAAAWGELKETFRPYGEWQAAKAGGAVEPLGEEKVRAYLDERYAVAVKALLDESRRTAFALDKLRLLEKLILYQTSLIPLVNNFVSFPYLYDPNGRASFEMGTLIMDGRHLTFSVRVDDVAQHSKVAGTSNIFVVYAEILDSRENRQYVVALPVTSGGKGNLCVGKRGIFQDVHGSEYDARIIQMIENPISIGETLVAPFHRIGRIVSGKIESMTTVAEKRLDKTTAAVIDGGAAQQPAATAPSNPSSRGLFAGGLLMGGGVALAALSTAAAYVTKTLADVGPCRIVLGILLAVVAVILPASIVAMLKLRRRDLSAILEGCGWAINARMRLTFKQGRVFTCLPPYPRGARGIRNVWLIAIAGTLLAVSLIALIRAVTYALAAGTQ